MLVDVFARFWLQIPSGCAKIRYKFIKSVGDEEEEYAAGGGIERGFIGWENLAPCRGRSLRSCSFWTRKRRYVLSHAASGGMGS